nr:unnamed protein product [Digitaria exilis]
MNNLEGRWWLVPPPPLLHLSCQSEKPVSKASCIHGYRHCDAASGTCSAQAMKSALPLHAVQTPQLCTCPQDSTHLDQETIPTPVAHHTPTIRARRTPRAPHLGQERNEPAHPTAILVPLLMPARAGHQVAHAARSAAARFSRSRAAPPPLSLSPAGGRLEGEERFVRGSRERGTEGDRRWEFLAVRAPFVVSGGLLVVGVATFHLEIMLGGASVVFVVSGGLLVVGVATFHLEIMLGGASVPLCWAAGRTTPRGPRPSTLSHEAATMPPSDHTRWLESGTTVCSGYDVRQMMNPPCDPDPTPGASSSQGSGEAAAAKAESWEWRKNQQKKNLASSPMLRIEGGDAEQGLEQIEGIDWNEATMAQQRATKAASHLTSTTPADGGPRVRGHMARRCLAGIRRDAARSRHAMARTSVFAAASATHTHCTDLTQMEACRRTSTPNNVQELVCLFLPVHRYLAGPYTECVLVVHACTVNKRRRLAGVEQAKMSMPRAMAVSVVDTVWALLAVWVSTCLSAATAVARAARTGEIGPLHIA